MPPSEVRSEEPDDDDGDFFEGIVLDDTEIEYESGEEPRWTIEGYLKKKGQRSILGKKPWSKKYFSIDSQDGKFNCAERHGAPPISSLDVSEITSIMLMASGKARFDIITGKVKEHELEAGSPEEAREWQQFLTLCVAKRDNDVFASEEKAASGQLRDGLMGPTNLSVLCGFMKKRYAKLNNSGNVWTTRYWKLIEKNRKVLAYFDKQGGKVLGLIPLEFVTAVSRNQKNNRRFVIIMKSNPPRMFDLMAPSMQEANEWIQRITQLQCESTPSSLRKDGSNIWKDVPSSAPRAEKEKQISQLRASDLSGPQLDQVVKKMTEGASFKRHEIRDGLPQSTSGTLQLDVGSQTLQWTGGRSSPTIRVSLLNITDLVVGCRDKAFGEPKPSVDCCFSIACKKESITLNLEAKTVEQAEMWLSGVHSLIKRSGKTSAEINHSEDSLSNIVTIMQQGAHFFRYEDNPQDKSVNKNKIFLFYELAEKGLGTLYWGSPIARCKTFAMPLSEIKQIMLGKATSPLQSKAGKSADPNRCCAIVGNGLILSLEAESRGKRGLWLNGIHRILASVKKVDRNVAPSVTTEGAPPAPLQLSSSVMGRFKKYDLNAAGTASTCEEVVVWFSPSVGRLGSLFWGKVDAPLEENSDRSLALHTLSDGFLGKRDQAYMVPAGSEADVNCCFTLFSRTSNRTLNLEAPDSATRQLWLSAIHAHLTPQTPKRPPDHALAPGGPSRSSSSGNSQSSQSSQPSHAPPSPDVAAAVAFMTKGRVFVMYDDKGRSEVFLYYRPSSKQVLGYLCWKESATAPENPNNIFPLRQLREIIGGKQSTPLQSPEASQADPSCCFHLKGMKMELSLQADSKQTRHEWFSALHKLMSASGKSKADGKTPEGGPPPAAKVSKKEEEVKAPLPKNERIRMFSPTTDDPETVFKLIAKIGQGSYGSVFKGIDKRDGSEVALKMLEYEPESMRDIQNEVDILKNCASPYIVALKGVFIKGKSIWIAMEYCAAGSLADMMQICHKTLTEKQIAVALRMSLLGLEYLHGQGIIHRDVKAANVLVTEAGDCKLADFGVSSEIQRTLSRKQTVIGTPNWMAPEVISESEYNQSADLWSLGIVAIELAVGEPPLSDLHPMTAMFKIPSNPPPQLPGPQDKWSPDFRSFVRVLLQKDPKLRPSCTMVLQHPFVRNARNNAVIKELVDECMVEMRSFRDLDATAGSAQGNTITYA